MDPYNNWNFDKIENLTVDPLPILKILNYTVAKKLLKLSILLLLMNYLCGAWQIHTLFYSNDITNVDRVRCTFLFGSYCIVVFGIPCLLYASIIMTERMKLYFSSLNCCSKQLQDKIYKTSNRLEKIVIVGILTIVWVLKEFITINRESELINNCSHCNYSSGRIILPFLFVVMFLTVCTSYIGFSIIPYFAANYYFQWTMLNERIQQINGRYPPTLDLLENLLYQNMIKKRIRFCSIYFQKLSGAITIFKRNNAPILASMHLLGSVMVLNSCFLWYLEYESNFWFILSLTVSVVCNCILNSELLQLVETEYDRLFVNLMNLPWYTFDRINKKKYLIFLMSVTDGLSLSRYQTIALNRKMISTYFAFCYRMCGVFRQLYAKQA